MNAEVVCPRCKRTLIADKTGRVPKHKCTSSSVYVCPTCSRRYDVIAPAQDVPVCPVCNVYLLQK